MKKEKNNLQEKMYDSEPENIVFEKEPTMTRDEAIKFLGIPDDNKSEDETVDE